MERSVGMEFSKVPVGFGMALAQNEKAVNVYAMMTREQKNTILAQAYNAKTTEEMQQIISDIAAQA